MAYYSDHATELYESHARRLGATATAQPSVVPLSQVAVFGPRPGGPDGARQDHMNRLYRQALSSPGSSSSIDAVVELYTTANQLYDPRNKVQMDNPAATRQDAKQALAQLTRQGWVNVNSLNPSYPPPPSAPKPIAVLAPVTPKVAPPVPRSPTKPPIFGPDAPPATYVNYLPTNLFTNAQKLLAPIVQTTSSSKTGTSSSSAPSGTTLVSAPPSSYDGGAAAVADSTGPAAASPPRGWLWAGVAAAVIVGGAVAISHSRRPAAVIGRGAA